MNVECSVVSFLIYHCCPFLGPETEVRGKPRRSWTEEKAQVVKLWMTWIYCIERAAASSGMISPSVCVCFPGCGYLLCKTP